MYGCAQLFDYIVIDGVPKPIFCTTAEMTDFVLLVLLGTWLALSGYYTYSYVFIVGYGPEIWNMSLTNAGNL